MTFPTKQGGGDFLPPLRCKVWKEQEASILKHTVSMRENYLFRRLYARGKSAGAATVAVYARRNHLEKNRLGLTVSTKVGKAVCRNKVRRRLKEAYRIHENQMQSGWDLVIVARVRAAFAPYGQLERELLRVLDKLGVRERPA